ncbi:MAG: arginine decarboxylase, pyruvoyl-dependent [Pseudomonadota bacterium]
MFGPMPTCYFLTAGRGEASTELNAFDAALLDAGVGDTNLIKMSSILPPAATEVEIFSLKKGSFVPLAYGDRTSNIPGEQISAAVAVGIPKDPLESGLIMEFSHIGDPDSCEKIARNMVLEGMEMIRKRSILEIKSISTSIEVTKVGAVFAAVVLCD